MELVGAVEMATDGSAVVLTVVLAEQPAAVVAVTVYVPDGLVIVACEQAGTTEGTQVTVLAPTGEAQE